MGRAISLTLGDLSGTISLDSSKFDKSLSSSQDKLGDFGAKGKVIAAAAGVAIGAALAAGIASAMNIDKATDKLAAQLGLNAKESEKAGKTAGKLYANAYGSSMEEVTGAVGAVMSSIKGMRDASSADVEAMTAKVLDLAAAFEIDAGRAAQVAGQMITSGLAKDGVQAADLLAGSLAKVPANVRGDIMDAVDEYAPFMASLGIKGEEAMGLLVTASEKGMYGIDKTGDALKEFGIRATDMSDASAAGYELLGMSQADMSAKLLAGGDTAKTAFGDIIHGLQEMTDPVAQSQAALALFGTPLEDLSVTEIPNFLGAIDPMGDKFDSLAGKADELGTTLNDNAATNLETFKRGLEMGIADALNNKVIPAINDAAKWLNTNFIPAMEGTGQWIKDNATWLGPLAIAVGTMVIGMGLWTGAIGLWKTVTATAAAIQLGLNAAMTANPIGIVVMAIAALVAGLVWFFTQTELGKDIVKNVWAWIQSAIAAVVDWFQNTAMPIIQEVFKVVGEVFTWLYENIIKPAFEGISTVVNAAWLIIKGIFQLVESVIKNVIGPAFQWLYDYVIKPVFDFIGSLIKAWWENIVMPVFNAVSDFVKNILGPAFNWFYENVIKPVWDRVATIIKNVWEKDLKPVFDVLADFIQKTIPAAFEAGVGFIKTAWDKLIEIAKMPVKFVVDTVINDGLIGAFNTVAGILPGIDKLPRVALPPGFANGGYTGNKPKGAVAGVVHGDEHVIRSESRRRVERTNPGLLDHINRTGSVAGYEGGGRVAPLKHMALTQGYNRVHKGIDYAATEGTPVYATENGRVSWSGPGAQAPGVWGGNEVHVDGGSGIQSWFAHLSSMAVRVGDMVRAGQQIALSGNTGITSGPHLHFGTFAGGWPNDIDPNGYLGGAGAPSGGGFNPIAGIIDGLVGKFKEMFPGGGMFADMAIGIGKKILDGASKWVTDTLGGGDRKGNTAGPTVYDGGGWLENSGGPQLVQHNKAKPDAVLSDQQWSDIHKLAVGNAGGGVSYSPTYQYMGEDPETLARRDRARLMDVLNSLT